MAKQKTTQSTQQPPEVNLALKQLEILVGKWGVEIVLPAEPANVIKGEAIFEWIEEGHFLAYRSSIEQVHFPTSTAIIGGDGTMGSYSMLYYDSRGVSRIYQMSLSNELWQLWRDDPKFPQRFTGTFSNNGRTLKAVWEKSTDGSTWELDFRLTYTKIK